MLLTPSSPHSPSSASDCNSDLRGDSLTGVPYSHCHGPFVFVNPPPSCFEPSPYQCIPATGGSYAGFAHAVGSVVLGVPWMSCYHQCVPAHGGPPHGSGDCHAMPVDANQCVPAAGGSQASYAGDATSTCVMK